MNSTLMFIYYDHTNNSYYTYVDPNIYYFFTPDEYFPASNIKIVNNSDGTFSANMLYLSIKQLVFYYKIYSE